MDMNPRLNVAPIAAFTVQGHVCSFRQEKTNTRPLQTPFWCAGILFFCFLSLFSGFPCQMPSLFLIVSC